MAESACLQCPKPLTEATVLVRPFLLQIDTFGKWCRCLHNVCYLKLKKRRYLDKCILSAPADSTEPNSMKCMHMISRDGDHSEGRGVGVNGRLQHFRKFLHFGTLTRPLDW